MSTPSDQPPHRRRRTTAPIGRRAAVASLCLLAAAGPLGCSLAAGEPDPAPAPYTAAQDPAAQDTPAQDTPAPRPAAHRVDPAAVVDTLAAFERAVRTGDRRTARDLAPRGDPATAGLLAALVDNAAALRVDDFGLRYLDGPDPARADGSWTATVAVSWRFGGFDRVPARAEVAVGLVEDDGRVALTGFGGHGEISPVWLAGPVTVRRTFAALIVVAAEAGPAASYAATATSAVRVVQRMLPRWRGALVLEVPSSAAALERALGAEAGSYDQIAAVTTAADGSAASRAPVHVFVNPEVFDGLGAVGARVVLSHEATHVALGAWDSGAPLWLIEGFADYVALRDVTLPTTRTAAQIIAVVRADGPPRRLPGAEAFGAHTPRLAATYESAWLACRVLAEVAGEDALVALYRAVDRGRRLGPALSATTGLTLAGLTARWRDHLRELAK